VALPQCSGTMREDASKRYVTMRDVSQNACSTGDRRLLEVAHDPVPLPVNVASVLDGHHLNDDPVVEDPVNHPELTAPR
jgi:hypothetical protein